MKGNMEERACALAAYIIENRATVRAAAKKFGVSKSTVHKDLQDRLPQFNRSTRPSVTSAAAWPREKNTRDFETFFDFLRLT